MLLSFSLGNQESFLWAITRDHLGIYPLPPASEIEQQITRLNQLEHGQFAQGAVDSLSKTLFGDLKSSESGKSEWLITADGVLLDRVPFSMLRVKSVEGSWDLLIRNHSLRMLPSEYLLLASAGKSPDNYFLGICDPIYNLADSRLKGAPAGSKASRSAITLARLVGSGREARDASEQSGLKDKEILSGKTANIPMLQKATSRAPEILHFAVHVVSPQGRPQEAALALSIGKDNIPELLTPETVATLRIPGSLVILSGCSSGQGDTAPSAGLMGLGRAWLLAGASAVVVSAWPTPDDSGQFFHVFYRQLQAAGAGSLARRAATALQQTQLEMMRNNGYRSLPSFWAAYSIFSKE